MKVLFCHDGPLQRDEFGNYYGTAHNDKTFRRYYTIANELAVAIRVNEISKTEVEGKFSKITVSPFSVKAIPNISKLKGATIDKGKIEILMKQEVSNADYVVARLPSRIGLIALKYAKEFNKPSLVELVACPWDSFWNHSIKGKIVAPFSYYNVKKAIQSADSTVYITRSFLQSRYKTSGKSYICPNVALKRRDNSIMQSREMLIENLKRGEKISIASIGAKNMRYKGHIYMIKAIKLLIQEGYNVEYHIIGSGDDSHLRKITNKYSISDNIKFHSAMPHDEIFDFLDNVHVYVQPSLAEAQGRSLIEAMSRGCLCVCTDVGGMPELIQNEFIAEKKNSKDLAEKIKLILNSDMKKVSFRNFTFTEQFDQVLIDRNRENIFNDVFNK